MARFTKIIFILSLLLISNNLNAKNPPPGTGTSDVPANILIMLDNSGSMSSRLSSSTLVLYPIDVATDSKGNVYVLEYGYTRIKVFDSSGNYLRSFGSSGRGCNQWYYAKAFTIYNDIIYLADMYGRRVLAMNLYGGVFQSVQLHLAYIQSL
jgi:type IV pilus assembly protein PilY1